ncbi:uncharacterized protein [Arachis hypogaea]|uniref:uncharacterized protein n=1 Tax=Arachis hypogaea TaxID=3818 RepID=UPI003B224705
MEHGHGGISDMFPCLYAFAATGTAAILRVSESSATWAKKFLDLGPQGIMFLIPPIGIRDSAHSIVRVSGYNIDEGYLGSYQEEMVIMCQVESVEGVKNDPGNENVRRLMREAEAKILKRRSSGGFGMETYLSGFAMLHDRPEDLNSQIMWIPHGV